MSGETDKDHIFGQAYGGRVTVGTHQTCNNRLGSGAEASLSRSNAIANLLRSFHGLATLPVRAVSENGAKWEIDFRTWEASPAKPQVQVEERDNRFHLSAEGTSGQLTGIVKDWRKAFGDQVPTFTNLPPEARGKINYGPVSMTFDATLDLEAAKHFAIKAALGAGALVFGGEFIDGPLAGALRSWRDAAFDNPFLEGDHRVRCPLRALEEAGCRIALVCRAAGLGVFDPATLPPLVPARDSRTNSVTFLPFLGRTAIFVHVLSFPMPLWGLVIDKALPAGKFGRLIAPIVVQENDKPWRVINWTAIITDAVSRANQLLIDGAR